MAKEINEDKVKRLSPLTSTGTNLRNEFPVGHPSHGITTYTTATLNTHKLASLYYDSLYDIHFKYYTDVEKLSETEAAKVVERKLEAYTKVDQTDAQVYISATMYRSMLERLGSFSEEQQVAFDLLESDKVLTQV